MLYFSTLKKILSMWALGIKLLFYFKNMSRFNIDTNVSMHRVTGPPQSAGVNVGGNQQHAPCHPQSTPNMATLLYPQCLGTVKQGLKQFCHHKRSSPAFSTNWGFWHSHLRNSLRKGSDWILISGWDILCVHQPQDSGWLIFSAFGQKTKHFLYTLIFLCTFSK